MRFLLRPVSLHENDGRFIHTTLRGGTVNRYKEGYLDDLLLAKMAGLN